MNFFKNIGAIIPIRYHVYFWITYFFINVIRWGSYFNDYVYSLKSNLVEFSIHILLAYFVIYFLMPKYILQRKYKRFVFYFFLLLVLVYFVRTGLNYLLVSKNIWPEAFGDQHAFTFNHFVAVTFGEVYVIALVSGIKLTADWIYEKNIIAQLQKETLKTELKFLKSQIRPHFFFNTLNNLYALTLEKSDLAPDLVLKLSEIMDFVIYDSQKSHVLLKDEIKYIKNYIAIEKIRFKNRIKSQIIVDDNLLNIKIPPLLFLPFIENSFKHGMHHNKQLDLKILFKKNNKNQIYFTITNNYVKNHQNDINNKGVGLKNIKRRLNLLYQNRYELKISALPKIFKVELSIPIDPL